MLRSILFPEAEKEDLDFIDGLIADQEPIGLRDEPADDELGGSALLSDRIEVVPFETATVRLVQPWLRSITLAVKTSSVVQAAEDLASHLQRMCVALVQQNLLRSQTQLMHERRNLLDGATPEQRYQHFAAWLASDDGTRAYTETFEVAVADARHRARCFSEEVAEVLERLDLDRASLGLLGLSPTARLASLRFGAGDIHSGRSVAIATFDDSTRLVYKPRSMQMEAAYCRLLAEVHQRWTPSSLAAPRAVDRGDYGWAEFVTAGPVMEASRAFHNMGELLGIMHTLRATDLHYENIIMHGDIPVPVDLETLLAAVPPSGAADEAPGALAVSQSVAFVGLLPSLLSTPGQEATRGVLNVGAIGYEPGQRSPFSSLVLNRPFTDEMHFTLEHLEHKEPALLPEIDPKEQVRHVTEGYTTFMRHLLADRTWFIEQVNQLFANAEIRFVALNTQRYSHVLRLATHPDLQRRRSDHDLALYRAVLFRRSTPRAVFLSEHRQLRNGDVPRLTFRSDTKHIYDERGIVVSDALALTPLEHVTQAIRALSATALRLNTWLIQLAFAPKLAERSGHTQFRFDHESVAPAPSASIEDRIAEQVEAVKLTSVAGSASHAPSWIGGRNSETAFQYWTVDELPLNLYVGSVGVALNLFTGGIHLKDDAAVDLAIEFFQRTGHDLPRTDTDWHNLPQGAYAGVESYLWAAMEVGLASNDSRLVQTTLELWTRAIHTPRSNGLDMIEGTPGILMALCSHIKRDQSGLVWELASVTAGRLAREAKTAISENNIKYSGYAHGLAGIYAALSQWAGFSDDQSLPDLVASLMAREADFADGRSGTRFGDINTVEARGWCHGAPGLLLAKALTAHSIPELAQAMKPDISRLTESTRSKCFGGNLSLCHGDLGNLWILADVAKLTNDEALQRATQHASDRYLAEVLPSALADVNRYTITQSVMVGTGGALAYMLKRVAPSTVRSPLWFGN